MRSVIQRERASALSPETGFDLCNVRSVESSWAHARHRELLRQLKSRRGREGGGEQPALRHALAHVMRKTRMVR